MKKPYIVLILLALGWLGGPYFCNGPLHAEMVLEVEGQGQATIHDNNRGAARNAAVDSAIHASLDEAALNLVDESASSPAKRDELLRFLSANQAKFLINYTLLSESSSGEGASASLQVKVRARLNELLLRQTLIAQGLLRSSGNRLAIALYLLYPLDRPDLRALVNQFFLATSEKLEYKQFYTIEQNSIELKKWHKFQQTHAKGTPLDFIRQEFPAMTTNQAPAGVLVVSFDEKHEYDTFQSDRVRVNIALAWEFWDVRHAQKIVADEFSGEADGKNLEKMYLDAFKNMKRRYQEILLSAKIAQWGDEWCGIHFVPVVMSHLGTPAIFRDTSEFLRGYHESRRENILVRLQTGGDVTFQLGTTRKTSELADRLNGKAWKGHRYVLNKVENNTIFLTLD
jgi:hypothetical protein